MTDTTFGGEVWTDEDGDAVVLLPPYLRGRELEYVYVLRTAAGEPVAASLLGDRLTIRSEAPHTKVEWSLTPHLPWQRPSPLNERSRP